MATIDTSQLTEDEGLSLFHQLRNQFNWAGTVFTRNDVRDAVDSALNGDSNESGESEPGDEQVKAWVDDIMGDYTYRKLEDSFSESGNEALYDAAIVLVNRGTL